MGKGVENVFLPFATRSVLKTSSEPWVKSNVCGVCVVKFYLRLKFDTGLIYLCVITLVFFSSFLIITLLFHFYVSNEGILINANCYINKKVMDMFFAWCFIMLKHFHLN